MFQLKNNDTRSYGFAGKICAAGSGNPTPPEAAKQIVNGQPFRLPGLFPLSADEMFKSFRGVLPAMKTVTREGKPAIEVLVEGMPLSVKDLLDWAAEHRSGKGLPEPRNAGDHAREVEKVMARPEDPLELMRRQERAQEKSEMVELVAAAVARIMRGETPPKNPAPPEPPAVGRNDEKPEDPSPAQGRARPR